MKVLMSFVATKCKFFAQVVNITFWPGEFITATDYWMDHFRDLLREHDFPEVNSHIFLGYNNYWKEKGLELPEHHFDDNKSGKGTFACTCSTDYWCVSIVEKPFWDTYKPTFLRVFLHEIGHNLGKLKCV